MPKKLPPDFERDVVRVVRRGDLSPAEFVPAIYQLEAAVRAGSAASSETLSGPSRWRLPDTAARVGRPDRARRPGVDGVHADLATAGTTISALEQEIADFDGESGPWVAVAAPRLLEVCGVGTGGAAPLLTPAGDDPTDCAEPCGVATRTASGGATVRHRPHPRGRPARPLRPARHRADGSAREFRAGLGGGQ